MAKKITKPSVFVLTRRASNPSLKGRYYPGYFRMPSVEEIFDEEKQVVRTIRYALGEPSIFKDEQTEGKVTLGDIVFVNGSIVIDRMNPNLLKFLAISNHNEGNPARDTNKRVFFRKLDPEASAKVSVEAIVNESKAVNIALTMDFKKLVGFAKVAGIDVDRSADEIRHDMILFAKQKPKEFLNGVDDPAVARQTVINQARELGLINFTGRSVKWTTGGKDALILTVPVGQNVPEFFAKWTMSEKDGETVFAELEKRVAKALPKNDPEE